MTRMGIRELRDTLTQALRRVRNGERIAVTHDETPAAPIVPYPSVATLVSEGAIIPARKPLTLPEPVEWSGPMSPSEILADGRGE